MNLFDSALKTLKEKLLPDKGEETIVKWALAFIFFGGFGLHAFRVGQNTVGIIILILSVSTASCSGNAYVILGETDAAKLVDLFLHVPLLAVYVYSVIKCKVWIKEFNEK